MEPLSSVRVMAELAAQSATEEAQREMDRQRKRGQLNWYLTSPLAGQSDRRAIDALELRRFETYYPMVREKRILPKRELTRRQRAAGIEIIAVKDRPFLPRYILVKMDISAGDWEIVSKQCGISGLACKERWPAAFADTLVKNMRRKEIDGAIPGMTPALTVFAIGETIKVIDGPFASFDGIVEKLRTKTIAELDIITGLRVAIDIFGRPTPVELNVDQVEKLPASDHG